MQAVEAAGYRTSLFGKTHLHPQRGDLRAKVPLMNRYGLQTVDETCGPKANRYALSNMTALWETRGVWDAYRADMKDRVGRNARPLARASVLPLDLYYDVYVGQAAARHLAALPADAPWFCWVSFGGPHSPWDAPEPYASMYAPEDMPAPLPRMERAVDTAIVRAKFRSNDKRRPMPPPEELARMRANYAGNVTLIDDQIGEILGVVQQRGESARTVVVFTSDHGEMNGDQGLLGKSVPFDPALKVPLIAAAPANGTGSGKRIATPVELMDVGATIADFAGARLPSVSQARSLRAAMEGGPPPARDFALSELEHHYFVMTQDWKAEFDADFSLALLFDRKNDPAEQTDLSASDTHRAMLDQLRDGLRALLAQTPPHPDAILRSDVEPED
jgi:choline-sulfatase